MIDTPLGDLLRTKAVQAEGPKNSDEVLWNNILFDLRATTGMILVLAELNELIPIADVGTRVYVKRYSINIFNSVEMSEEREIEAHMVTSKVVNNWAVKNKVTGIVEMDYHQRLRAFEIMIKLTW